MQTRYDIMVLMNVAGELARPPLGVVAALVVLALIGIVAASLALREHYRTGASPCSINERWDWLTNLPRSRQEPNLLFVHGSARDPLNEYKSEAFEMFEGLLANLRSRFGVRGLEDLGGGLSVKFQMEGGFSAEQDDVLLRAYFGGNPPAHEVGRMVAYKAMCDWLWTLWGILQHVNENPVDDFWAYAVGRFERCATLMSSADYSERLASVLAG